MQVTRPAVQAADFSLKQTEERLKQVREMRRRTLVSLLHCFSEEDGILSNTQQVEDLRFQRLETVGTQGAGE